MRRTVPLALLSGGMIAVAVTLVSGSAQRGAYAREGCANHSLRGAYGFATDGQAFDANGEFAEIASAGRIVFDGHGNLTGRETESLNGSITEPTFWGTYSVQPDCTGTATIHSDLTTNLRFVLVEGGQEVNVIDTDPGVVAAGQITRQELTHCTLASVKGVYSFAASGSFYAAGAEVGDFAGLGRIQFDGRGHATESFSSSFNGSQSADIQTATYTVNADCTGTYTSTHPNGQVDHVNTVLVEGGAEIKFIVTDAGAVASGTVDKQATEGD